jgi:hypothetical protein
MYPYRDVRVNLKKYRDVRDGAEGQTKDGLTAWIDLCRENILNVRAFSILNRVCSRVLQLT